MRHNFEKGAIHGIWEIISDIHKGLDHVTVKSTVSGYAAVVKKVNLTQGKVKDYYAPSVEGIGYIGRGKYSPSVNKKSYNTWKDMLRRVTKPTKTYEDVSICNRWLNFQWFCEDIRKLEGFKLWACSDNIHLDKDKIGSKIYSPETCVFLTCEDNHARGLRAYSRIFYVVKDMKGNLYDVINQREFCETYGLPVSNFNAMLKGNRSVCKGFSLVSSSTEKVYTRD